MFLGGSAQPFDDVIGDVHAGNLGAHVFGRFLGTHRPHADQEINLVQQPHIAHPVHVGFEARHVKAVLGLDEVSAGGDLFGQARNPNLKRIGKRIGCRADEHLGTAVQLITT